MAMTVQGKSGLPSMGGNPNQDEALSSARQSQISVDVDPDQSHDSDDNVQLSSYQQWKLVMNKNRLLMGRDMSTTICITCAPALIILAISALVLLGGSDSYDPTIGAAYSMRDSSMSTMVWDKNHDVTKIFTDQKDLIGDVLFASTTSEFAIGDVKKLCNFAMNDNTYTPNSCTTSTCVGGLYINAKRAIVPGMTVMPTTCSGTGCACAEGTQIFDSIDALDSKILELAATGSYKPVMASVVIDGYNSADKTVSWYFYYNRTTVKQTIDQVNDFTFYNSMYAAPFSINCLY